MSMDTEYCDYCGYLHDKLEDEDCPTCGLIKTKNEKITKLEDKLKIAVELLEVSRARSSYSTNEWNIRRIKFLKEFKEEKSE